MDFAADFTTIDFETANRRRDSACQLAAVVVRGGQIVDQAMWMIRPEPFYFSPGNIQIHGITPGQVQQEPNFGQQWDQIAEKLAGDCLVAHNASFDIGVLLACLRAHQKEIPDLQFSCTRAVARRTWPHRPRFGLKPLAQWLGIRFRHHDALEDSIACAKIMLAAGIDREAQSLGDLEERLRLSRGQAGSWGHRGPSVSRSKRSTVRLTKAPSASKQSSPIAPTAEQPVLPFLFPGQVGESKAPYQIEPSSSAGPLVDLQRMLIRADFIRPLAGQRVVLAGRFRTISHDDAERLAVRLGGTCQSTVDSTIDLVVIGKEQQALSESEQAALSLKDQGNPIRIVNEDEFLGLVIAQSDV